MAVIEKVNKKLGGTAFPHPGQEDAWSGQGVYPSFGMSLRDYFAARAMAGLIAGDPGGMWIEPDEAAKRAYAYADALILERGK